MIDDLTVPAHDNRSALSEISARAHAGESVHITCYGDSQVRGEDVAAKPYNIWPNRLQVILRKITGSDTIVVGNAGTGGKKIIDNQAIDNFDRKVTAKFASTHKSALVGLGLPGMVQVPDAKTLSFQRTYLSDLIA